MQSAATLTETDFPPSLVPAAFQAAQYPSVASTAAVFEPAVVSGARAAPVSKFRGVLARAAVVTGLFVTLTWISFLAYGLVNLVISGWI